MKKSLGMNAILNASKTVLGVLFPLMTLPYASRVLQVEKIGKVNFSHSFVNYFILIAGLGIATYATREGAALRNDKKKFEEFANQIFSLNIITTIISYLLLWVVVLLVPKFQNYSALILVQSLAIVGTTIGVNWLYQVYEDYLYITVRTLVFQFISLILLFALVHDQKDYVTYSAITTFSNVGSNMLNLLHAKKYWKIRFTLQININKHLKPILVFFASSVAITVYVNSDTTMIGFLCNEQSDYHLGLYSISVKIYNILKNLVSAFTLVALPRLANLTGNGNEEDYNKTVTSVYNYMMLVLMPVVAGIFMISKDVILLVGGNSYLEASTSLRILCIALLFSGIATFMSNALLYPNKMEDKVLWATVISAIVNILLNFIFIPKIAERGAAITTLLSEAIVCAIEYYFFSKCKRFVFLNRNVYSVLAGILLIFISCGIIALFQLPLIFEVLLSIVSSMILYVVALILLKNEYVLTVISNL